MKRKNAKSINRQSRVPGFWLHQIKIIVLSFLLLPLSVGLAGKRENAGTSQRVLHYKPFSEAEIRAAGQRPLTLEDCIRIALAKNISLKITRDDYLKAEASHSGTRSIFYPTLSFSAQRERTNQDLTPAGSDSSQGLELDNQSIVGTFEQLLPTGAQLTFTSDLSRDQNRPNRFQPSTKTKNRRFTASLTQPLLRGAWPTVVGGSITTSKYDRDMQDRQLLDTSLQTVFMAKEA
ncbi:TolC family protein, partial [bacterium]|nr:TolC family protein [bacterium]